ncbi:hypothetical protein D3C73_1402560 [compost metagenome]
MLQGPLGGNGTHGNARLFRIGVVALFSAQMSIQALYILAMLPEMLENHIVVLLVLRVVIAKSRDSHIRLPHLHSPSTSSC